MADEYIRKQDVVEALAKTMQTPATPDGAGEFDYEIHIADEAFADAIRIIKSLEPADVIPVKHGRWSFYDLGVFKGYICSECNRLMQFKGAFCPHCGAKMDKE